MAGEAVLNALGASLARLAQADVTARLEGLPEGYGALQTDFNRAIETKPDLGEAYVNRGAAAVGARRRQRMLELFEPLLHRGRRRVQVSREVERARPARHPAR